MGQVESPIAAKVHGVTATVMPRIPKYNTNIRISGSLSITPVYMVSYRSRSRQVLKMRLWRLRDGGHSSPIIPNRVIQMQCQPGSIGSALKLVRKIRREFCGPP
jgi:hypothetical protein